MPKINFTSALNRFFPGLETLEIEAKNIAELLDELELKHPGIKDYLVNEEGSLRKHINIFIGDKLLQDRKDFRITYLKTMKSLFFKHYLEGRPM